MKKYVPAFTLPHWGRSAFSLIELLVVIAVIGVLAAVIVPAVSRVRTQARESTSVSNLREIGMITHLYVADNNGRLPSKVWNREDNWLKVLYFLAYEESFDSNGYINDPFSLSGTIFWSPVLDKSEPEPWRSYGFNAYSPAEAVNINRVMKPSETLLIADAQNRSDLYKTNLSYRNSGKCHVLFVDGHVSALAPEEVSMNHYERFWQME